jgi:phosphopantothenoylcysteine decarboxylase / phosphopantothenate---cysteine ligase
MLKNKTIVLGVTGSIAAFKAADIASKLTQAGANVEVVMTEPATRFISPITMHAVTGRTVITDMFAPDSRHIEHITLGEIADLVVVAPATASIIASLAGGFADDMVSLTVLATRAPVVLAPAMDVNMFANPVTQENLSRLKARGFIIIDPGYGRMASGKVGWGRLADLDIILGTINQVLGRNGDLKGQRLVVTAGGTQEPIDPVRCLTNRSSGRMGYAIAEAARDRGAEVKLIAAATVLPDPVGVAVIRVETAAQMKEAVATAMPQAEVLIMAAAVADYRPKAAAKQKIKKSQAGLTLELVRTVDILSEVQGDFIKVGFAAESENLVENARKKLKSKGLDLIVANDITALDSGFSVDTNRVVLIGSDGLEKELPLMSKREVADRILDRVAELLGLTTCIIDIKLKKADIEGSCITIPVEYRDLFPSAGKVFGVAAPKGMMAFETRDDDRGLALYSRGLAAWCKENGLKAGRRVTVKVKQPRDYFLELAE